MTNLKIYKKEQKDGLEALLTNNTVSFASSINQFVINPEQTEIYKTIAKLNREQPDLIHRYAILASTGRNENDDIFGRAELYNARETPTDKQVNFMHNEMNIIGHMTEAFMLDENGVLLDNGLTLDQLPERFDIGVGFVLYTMWENEERAALMERVVSEIDSGNWFVSMECRFPDFDYGVFDSNGLMKTVSRTEETSFLTKHLRAYGGTGVYQGYRVARVLKQLFFSGKGIVENPANKRSVIFGNFEPFSSKGELIIRENIMDEKEILELKASLAAAKAENEGLKNQITEKAKAAVSAEVDTLKSQLAEAAKEITAKDSELASAKANLSQALAEAKEFSEKLAKANEEIAKAKLEAVKASRISQLVKAGLSDAKAAEVYAKWSSVADEQFADIVSLHTKAETCMDDEEKEKEKAAAEKAAAEKAAADKVAADLAKAELEKTQAGNSSGVTQDISTLAQRLSRFMPKATAANITNKE